MLELIVHGARSKQDYVIPSRRHFEEIDVSGRETTAELAITYEHAGVYSDGKLSKKVSIAN